MKLSVPEQSGLPHLAIIRRAMHDLHRRFPPQHLLGSLFPISVSGSVVRQLQGDASIAGVQRLASAVLAHFAMPPESVVVAFSDGIDSAAQVEIRDHTVCLVTVRTEFKGRVSELAALIAHEVCHLFLHKLGVAYIPTLDNELLTDTAAVYLGAGWPSLNVQGVRSRGSHEVVQHIGYLTTAEFGYVLAKRVTVTREPVTEFTWTSEAKSALAAGLRLAQSEATQPPLQGASCLRRAVYRHARRSARDRLEAGAESPIVVRRWMFERQGSLSVRYSCPVCWQVLRVACWTESSHTICPLCRSGHAIAS